MQFEEVDLSRGLSASELNALIGSRDYQQFLNPRNELYRAKKMKEKPPPRGEALRLMSKNPNLVRRPILVEGAEVVAGFDQERYKAIAPA